MKVPFACFDRANVSSRPALDAAYQRVIDSQWFILGREVEGFERDFAAFCGAKYCVGVANGLDAIQLLLVASEVGPGAEVIVAANTYIATWLGVSHAGARPIPVEPDAATFNLDPGRIADKITSRTRAIFGTHLYGRAGACVEIDAIGHEHNLPVFWDAAHAHGATVEGQPICRFGNASAFSFYPTKNLGCLGDGGAVVTNDSALADKVRRLRNYGCHRRYENECLGYNSRLDELQASFLRVKLPELVNLNAKRATAAGAYKDGLSAVPGIVLPEVVDGHVWHLFVIRHPERDDLRQHLLKHGIQTDIHYPTPPHLQPAYSGLGFRIGDFPISEKIHREVLSLPMHPFLSQDEIAHVCATVKTFCI
ncbi:MAG TPA: DegT/DnrJ/EryC1/StrS family aminotransferase [Lacunisphaera sp.]|jgi:dTDP-4-amino-4,6-dideoxygalactose transaminase